MKSLACAWIAAVLLAFALPAAAVLPAAYAPMVVEPRAVPEGAEFDLDPALQRARREGKSLYVYLGAHDCPFCRRYEAFLARHADELAPQFAKRYIVVDLRSALSIKSARLLLRIGGRSQVYADALREMGDERARQLVYPSVWLLDAQARPLMQMPAGNGTFETVEEQLEILNLQQ